MRAFILKERAIKRTLVPINNRRDKEGTRKGVRIVNCCHDGL